MSWFSSCTLASARVQVRRQGEEGASVLTLSSACAKAHILQGSPSPLLKSLSGCLFCNTAYFSPVAFIQQHNVGAVCTSVSLLHNVYMHVRGFVEMLSVVHVRAASPAVE